jgi:hypothetical protein
MTDKLRLYNSTLMRLGARPLASLSENRKSRRVLDAIWDNDFVKRILEKGQWNFAVRTYQSTYDNTVTPAFGYEFAHEKPSDWVRTIGVSANENFNPPFNDYEDERSHIYANYDTLYFRIISADQFYGGDLSLWPQSVVEYAELEFAALACKPITDSDVAVAELRKQADRVRREAKAVDGMNGPSKRMPMGSWASARFSGNRTFGIANNTSSASSGSSSSSGGGVPSGGGFSDGFSEGFF